MQFIFIITASESSASPTSRWRGYGQVLVGSSNSKDTREPMPGIGELMIFPNLASLTHHRPAVSFGGPVNQRSAALNSVS